MKISFYVTKILNLDEYYKTKQPNIICFSSTDNNLVKVIVKRPNVKNNSILQYFSSVIIVALVN